MSCLQCSPQHRISVVLLRRAAIFVNCALVCVGLLYMAVSTVLMVLARHLDGTQLYVYRNIPILLIVVGILACIGSVIGFCGFQQTKISLVVILYDHVERWLESIYTGEEQEEKHLKTIYLTENQGCRAAVKSLAEQRVTGFFACSIIFEFLIAANLINSVLFIFVTRQLQSESLRNLSKLGLYSRLDGQF
ncbi:unnamed protein product [Dibothriocephalus latus]|uniref:Tetraspanin n=1 Tax=Dibothriocephalus latus TaxID=60516 RepID=A0A3P7Q3K8_DIBLA|nr:unnamed protein product [Dibothriocephalus latus]